MPPPDPNSAADVVIRPESPDDAPGVDDVLRDAFSTTDEMVLVNELRTRGEMRLALVAELNGEIVGHVAVSPMAVEANGQSREHAGADVCAIGPLAVLGALQRNGIGAMLMAEAIQRLRDGGADLIALLGDPDYYERFRFTPAREQQLACKFDGGDAFQIRPLSERGQMVRDADLRYASAFDLFDAEGGEDPL